MAKRKYFFLISSILVLFFLFLIPVLDIQPLAQLSQPGRPNQTGTNIIDVGIITDPNQPAGVKELQALIQRLLNVGVALAFIALTAVLVWAGIKFLTSGGDQKQIQSAYDMITWAVIGILFLALAWIIILLIENFTGVKVTQFCIGFDCQ